ncbi:MAG: hypothetical protein AAFP82_17875 [Bacteroidota bacterium]
MEKNRLLFIALISISVAVVVVIVLKSLGHDNPTVMGGSIAGGVAGAITGAFLKKKKS